LTYLSKMTYSADAHIGNLGRKELKLKTVGSMRLRCGVTFAAIALATPAHAAAHAGKATYNASCIQCHGPAGDGNPVADRSWKIRIPRLNGAYVQNKSDAELTHIILNGKRKMPPAMMMLGNPDTAHKTKISAEQVPDLIAYIRTQKLKK
jgi:mono/diheme cytochrome c family protein